MAAKLKLFPDSRDPRKGKRGRPNPLKGQHRPGSVIESAGDTVPELLPDPPRRKGPPTKRKPSRAAVERPAPRAQAKQAPVQRPSRRGELARVMGW